MAARTKGSTKRTTRARTPRQPEPMPEPPLIKHGAVIQEAIDRMGDAADAVPQGNQIDSSNLNNEINRSSAPPDPLDSAYNQALARGRGHLAMVRSAIGRSTIIPPACEIHPKLGKWALNLGGKWLVIRWVRINQQNRQRRFEQGYQYFEGNEMIRALGLNPEAYKNERGRVQIGDTELAWVPEEFVFEHMDEAKRRQEEMSASVRDNMYAHQGDAVPDIHVLEGSEGEVMDGLDRLRKGGRR